MCDLLAFFYLMFYTFLALCSIATVNIFWLYILHILFPDKVYMSLEKQRTYWVYRDDPIYRLLFPPAIHPHYLPNPFAKPPLPEDGSSKKELAMFRKLAGRDAVKVNRWVNYLVINLGERGELEWNKDKSGWRERGTGWRRWFPVWRVAAQEWVEVAVTEDEGE